MKNKKRKIIAIVATAVMVSLVALVFFNLPKPITASNMVFDLTQIAEGAYQGSCYNGLVKVSVEVEVQNHEIAEVKILKHDNGLGGAAEVIVDEVVKQQSVEIDAVSGATMSSKTILKAVENALSGKGEEE